MANEKQFKVGADFNKQQLLQVVLENISVSTVAAPVKGQIVYNIVADATYDSDKVYYYNGAKWVNISEDKMTFESSDSSITITIPGTGADVDIKVNPGNILHSRLNNDETTNNPHQVSLNQVLTRSNDAGGKKIVNLADGTDPNDVVNKSQLDAIAAGLNWVDPVAAATTTNTALSGLITIDTVLLKDGDRVLVKDQTNKTENGIYIAHSGTWTRSLDSLEKAALTSVGGGVNLDHEFIQTTSPVVIGTSEIKWIQFGGASIQAGAGMSQAGNVFNVGKGDGITVLLDTIAFNASEAAGDGLIEEATSSKLKVNVDDSTIEIASDTLQVKDNGITGPKINSSAIGIGLEKESVTVDKKIQVKPYSPPTLKIIAPKVDANGVGIPIDGDTIKANPTGELYVDTTVITGVKKYASPLMTPMTVGTHTITHNLGTRDVIVMVYESDANPVEVFIAVNGDNSLDVTTNVEIVRAKVVIIG